jgi:hypothetical protein
MFADIIKKEDIALLKKRYNEEHTCKSQNQEFIERIYAQGGFLNGN